MKKPSSEVVASLLAASTLLTPFNFPPWAIFITWAGTFAMGGPSRENLRRIWPVMPIGSFTAFLIVLCFNQASLYFTGGAFLLAQAVILFTLNGSMMLLGRIPRLSFIPGMFFGFATYFATYYGGFGPILHDAGACLLAAICMNAIGPVYAWLTVKFGAAHGHHAVPAPEQRPPQKMPSA
jgi:hypothetical protein